MSGAYRCDECGQFGEGSSTSITIDTWEPAGDDWKSHTISSIDLCPACAPDVLAPLIEIARTKHGGEA